MTVTILGCGTSHGVPVPGCDCSVCRSQDPKDKRYRSSVMVQSGGRTLVIDTTPEFRLQSIRAGIRHIDGVLYTHAHADHFNGIDDLRSYSVNYRIPVWSDSTVASHIRSHCSYMLHAPQGIHDRLPHLDLKEFVWYEPFSVAGFEVLPLPVEHGKLTVSAFRIGDFVYCTDCAKIPDRSFEAMRNPSLLIIDCLRDKRHPSHFCLSEALETAGQLNAEHTVLTHMTHVFGYQDLLKRVPDTVEPGYDTLSIEV